MADRKRKKGFWRGARKRRRMCLEIGMKGVLVTCNKNEKACIREAYNLLNEYADEMYGPEIAASDSGSESEDGDVEAALAKEVAQMKDKAGKEKRRFQAMDSGANNVVFIQSQLESPDELVHHILDDINTSKKFKTRNVLRMIPVMSACKAYLENVKKSAEEMFPKFFSGENNPSYAIVFKTRNSGTMKRDEVIKALAGVVSEVNPACKVNLNSPDLAIVIEVIRTVCCMSVLKDYFKLKKYNIHSIVEGTKDDPKPREVKDQGSLKVDLEAANGSEVKEGKDDVKVQESKVEASDKDGNSGIKDDGVSAEDNGVTGQGSKVIEPEAGGQTIKEGEATK
ncbi:THUMP domain-containing protein 1-like [Branchiostoma lanceolatum]|uniref:THUMP domain-containing protein 1-like n=1 Tax=Branchiostoma lanceolatum TaxID=7740 RepID=UPI0034538C94